jgi:hypothetical protein
MSQFREGSLGRLSNHEGGMPVYSSAILIPDFGLPEMTSWLTVPRALWSLIPRAMGQYSGSGGLDFSRNQFTTNFFTGHVAIQR